ncbi:MULTISPECIES: pectinesterase family protein [unclassified Sphingomonas]|uniref:pectinesterase family protein n=1 Tax=unclassified Sphingomonas TaxID=196159 RepID=UPI0009E6795A|nr:MULTISPECIES: pectinesterase family protein [unclassified Sphingomonas]
MRLAPLAVMLATIAVAAPAQPAARRVVHVSPDRAGAYRSVQRAIDALATTGGTILIAPGRYREKLVIRGNDVRLRGTGRTPADVVLVYSDASATVGGTLKSASMTVSGDGFHATNLTIQNDYWLNPAHPPSQAVALALTGDRAVVRRVRLLGHQDTLYANRGPNRRPTRQYFRDCYIEGHVDFIFGDANAYFNRCQLHGLAHETVWYTAQSRNAPDDEGSAYVFDRSRFTAAPGARNIALGRAWRPHARVILLDARLDAPVIPAGWTEWTPGKTTTLDTAYFAEYRSRGQGASPATREPRTHQLTAAQARRWRLPAFFGTDTGWLRD